MIGAIKRAVMGARGAGKTLLLREQMRRSRHQAETVFFRRSRLSHVVKGTETHAPIHGNWWTRLRMRQRIGVHHAR